MHRLPYLLLPLLFAACATPASRPDVTARADVTAPPTAERAPDAPRLEQLHPDVWVHVSTQLYQGMPVPSNGLVVRDGDGLLLVDTAWGEAETAALLDAIEAEIGLPVRRAIVTHFHDDSVSGARVLEERGVVVHGTPHTQRLAAEEGNAVPSSRLEGLDEVGSAISLGPVEVFYPGAGHAPDNVVVYVPGAGVLFGGCAVAAMARKDAGNVSDAVLPEWPSSIRRVQERYREARVVVPGHGAPGGTELLSHTIAVVEAHRGE